MKLTDILKTALAKGASDIHLKVGNPPIFRIDGSLRALKDAPRLSPEMIKEIGYSVMADRHKERFQQDNEIDLSYAVSGMGRFRVNVFRQRGSITIVFRVIPFKIPFIDELLLPPIIEKIALKNRGLVLVTGTTGSGKSTTLAAMINHINTHRNNHVITIEDPIEFLHRDKKSIINQREVGEDTGAFATALRSSLRQDPDVVLVGEMRDLETIEAALNISETGHLAFATLHTNSAPETINRIIDVFPTNQQEQIRVTLSFTLQAVVAQQLIPKVGGGRVVALEILVCTPAIRAIIRDDKIHQIYSMIQSGQKYGMRTMNMSLAELYRTGKISLNDCMGRSTNPQELSEMLSKQSTPAFA